MRLRIILLICAAASLASCAAGGGPARGLHGDGINGVTGWSLPALPDDTLASTDRRAAFNSLIVSGNAFFDKGGTTVDFPAQLQLNPMFKELSYAIYRFPVAAGDSLQQISYYVEKRDMVNLKVWLAVANYKRHSWEFFPGLAQDSAIYQLAGQSSDYTSPGGYIYAALFAYSVGGFTIDHLELWKNNLADDANSWAMFGRDAACTHRAAAAVVPQANVLWKSSRQTRFISSSPVVSPAGELFIGSWTSDNTGAIYAIDASGSEMWHRELTDYIAAAPALGPDGAVYVACHDWSLYCFSRSGDLRWRFQTAGALYSSPLVGPDGMIYFGSVDSALYCVSPKGQEVWKCDTAAGVYGAPALAANGMLYCTNAQGQLSAIDSAGGLAWVYTGVGRAEGAPCIGQDGTAYFATRDGNAYAVYPDGTLRGTYSAGGSFIASPALDSAGNIWIGNTDGRMYCLTADAALSGSFIASSGIECSAAIDSGDRVCFASNDGHIYVIQPDLSLLWEYPAAEGIRSSCCISAEGGLYFAGVQGTVFAFGANAPQPPAAPTGLSASDGTQVGKIILTWNEGFDANGYEIYKDAAIDPIATVGYVQHWEDAVADLDAHTYQLKAVNEYGTSAFSASDTGFAAAAPELSSWALYRGNPAQTNCAPNPGPDTTPVETVIDLSFGHHPGPVAFAPDGSFYVVDSTGLLHSFSSAGVPGWTYTVADNEPLSPAIGPAGNCHVHVSEEIQALDILGAFQWSYAPGLGSGLTIAGMDAAGRVYISSYSDGQLRCVDQDGNEVWTYDPGSNNNYTICAIGSDGAVYFPDGTSGLVALHPDGAFAWRFSDSVALASEPCVKLDSAGGDLIYVNSSLGLACLDTAGAVLWYAHDGALNPVFARPTLAPDGTIFTAGGSYLKAINPDGTLRQQITLSHQVTSKAIAADSLSNVYVGTNSSVQSYDSQLVLRWSLNTVASFADATLVIGPDDKLYLNDNQYKIHLFSN